jgi:hypothetical protein
MAYHYDHHQMRWIPKHQPLSRPFRQVTRLTLLRGLVEEIVYEDSLSKLYAGLLVEAICKTNPRARYQFEQILACEQQKNDQHISGL